jgi:probable phosphoglycerate mutase
VQAERVAARLAGRGASEILVSPARRTRETAEPVSKSIGKDPIVIDDLLEIGLPDWSEMPLEHVASEFKRARARHPAQWWEGIPGGETFRAFRTRIERCLEGILTERGVTRIRDDDDHPLFEEKGDAGRVVIVGHGGTNSVAMGVLLGVTSAPWEWERFSLNHAAILRLKTVHLGGGVIFSLRAHNDCEHLPRELRTR